MLGSFQQGGKAQPRNVVGPLPGVDAGGGQPQQADADPGLFSDEVRAKQRIPVVAENISAQGGTAEIGGEILQHLQPKVKVVVAGGKGVVAEGVEGVGHGMGGDPLHLGIVGAQGGSLDRVAAVDEQHWILAGCSHTLDQGGQLGQAMFCRDPGKVVPGMQVGVEIGSVENC